MAEETMKKVLLAIISLLFIACQHNVVYTEFKSIPNKGWHSDSAIHFDAVLTDSLSDYTVTMTMRHTDRYAYQNLWLFVDIVQDSLLLRRDTVNAMLADNQGKWYGSGVFVKELEMVYLNNIVLPLGEYQIVLQQAMRTEMLNGISDIGLKIIKNTEDGKE